MPMTAALKWRALDGTALPARPSPRQRAPRRAQRALSPRAMLGIDSFLPALGVSPEIAVLTSAALAATSVVVNFYSGSALEQKRAELALELERDKVFQKQLADLQVGAAAVARVQHCAVHAGVTAARGCVWAGAPRSRERAGD